MLGPLERDPLEALANSLVGQSLPGSQGRSYPLRARIGDGGQGWVFRASWDGGVDVVVKVLRPDLTSDEALGRFQREAEVLRMLSQKPMPNPHVVRFLDHASAAVFVPVANRSWTVVYTVLEFVDGDSLEQALEKTRPSGIGLARALRILRHVTLALEDVHAHKVVHRDLKPSNILLATSGAREIAKVTDFGLAKRLEPGMQRTSHIAGATIGYAPPEQFENGNLRVGPETDVFSLAAVFYELVSGEPAFPFRANDHPLMVVVRILNEARPSLARVRSKLPPDLAERHDAITAADAELSRALDPEPGRRHRSVRELCDGLDRALSAVTAAPSTAVVSNHGGVIVRESELPDIWGDRAHASSASSPPNTPVSMRDGWSAMAVDATGDSIVAVGPRGPHLRDARGFRPVEVPVPVEPAALAAAAWLDDSIVLAGACPFVVILSPRWPPGIWRVEEPGVVFHGAFADVAGIVLAGERVATRSGVLGEIAFGESRAPRIIDVGTAPPLRAVCRTHGRVVACGDAGAMVQLSPGTAPHIVRICDASLSAIVALDDGTVITVGSGGFVFEVSPRLEARLEPIQTTRDLFALARDPAGTLFCGGSAGRVLRRDQGRWVRLSGRDAEPPVRALHATWSRVRVFLGDGTSADVPAR